MKSLGDLPLVAWVSGLPSKGLGERKGRGDDDDGR